MLFFSTFFRFVRAMSRPRTRWIMTVGLVCAGLAACEPASEPGASPSSHSTHTVTSRDGGEPRSGTDGPSRSTQVGDNPTGELPKIVAFGNSLTAGLGVPSGDSYPSQLQRRLEQAGYRYRVINAGISGDTTAGAVRRLEWVLKSRPHIVIVELGANDGLRGLNLDQTRTNLARIIERLQSAGVTIVLAGMQLPPNYGADYTKRFSSLYPELARKYDVALMPFFLEGVGAQAALNQADGIHPTQAGYRVIVEHLLPVLEPLLQKSGEGRS